MLPISVFRQRPFCSRKELLFFCGNRFGLAPGRAVFFAVNRFICAHSYIILFLCFQPGYCFRRCRIFRDGYGFCRFELTAGCILNLIPCCLRGFFAPLNRKALFLGRQLADGGRLRFDRIVLFHHAAGGAAVIIPDKGDRYPVFAYLFSVSGIFYCIIRGRNRSCFSVIAVAPNGYLRPFRFSVIGIAGSRQGHNITEFVIQRPSSAAAAAPRLITAGRIQNRCGKRNVVLPKLPTVGAVIGLQLASFIKPLSGIAGALAVRICRFSGVFRR